MQVSPAGSVWRGVTVAAGNTVSVMSTSTISAQLSNIMGIDAIVDSAQLPDYAIGPLTPVAAVRPADADGVAAVLAWAHRSGVAVYPSGGRTLMQLGNLPTRPGIALDLTRLNRLVDFQPADLTVSVEAGMTIAQLDAALAQEGKYVPISAPLAHRATIGGTLATGVSGPLRAAYGLPRDWLIGINVVGADGTPTKAGGKVVKNVTGYDLNRLYTGSLGTLAVITEATFKLAPAPGDWAVVVASFSSVVAAARASQDLQRQYYAPLGLQLLTGKAASHLVSAFAGDGSKVVAVAVVGGRPASVNRRVGDTVALWGGVADEIKTVSGQEAVNLVDNLTDLPADPSSPATMCVRVNAPPSALDDLLAFPGWGLVGGAPPAVVADVGFGGGRLMWWEDLGGVDPIETAGALGEIQSTAASLGGDAVLECCPNAVKQYIDAWGSQRSGMAIMRRIKQQFDPENVLNPGRFIGGL